MPKPVITIDPKGPNAQAGNLIGVAHAAIMEQGFRALKECRDYQLDGELIVQNYTTVATLMKNAAYHARNWEETVEAIEKYVTINWK